MKPTKIFLAIILITFIALSYVRQQVELLELGYDMSKKERVYLSLLDQNDQLRYNIMALSSPNQLAKGIALTRNKFVILESSHILKAGLEPASYKVVKGNVGVLKKIGQLAEVFAFRTQAEAKPINK
jgi:hypothetical protein